MARSRNIKPGFFVNADLVELPAIVRLLFIGLWTIADRDGRMEDRPAQIKMQVLPGDDINMVQALDMLGARQFIVRYRVDDKPYIQISNFNKHQNPHIKEPKSVIPPPPIEREEPLKAEIKQGDIPASCKHRACLVLAGLIPDSLLLIPDTNKKPSSPKDDAFIPCDQVIGAYHTFCPSLPKVRELTDKRRQMIKGWCRRYAKIEGGPQAALDLLLKKAEGSDFLTGKTGDWKAGFDWLFKEANTVKVMEGNYDNKGTTHGRQGSTGSAAHPRTEKGKPQGSAIDSTPKPAGHFAGDFPDRSDEW